MNVERIIKYYRFNFDNTHTFSGHTHNTYELNIVLNGVLEVTVNQNVLKLNAGDMALWSPMMFHCDKVVSAGDTEFLAIHFSLEEALIRDFIGFYRLDYHNMMLVKMLIDEIEQNEPIITETAKAIFTTLLLRSKKNEQTPEYSQHTSALIYHNAVDLMTKNLHRNLHIADIERCCCVCETTLKNAFRLYTGKSIKKYYQDFKMQKAKEMLLSGKTAKDVSNTLGYSSLSYFSQQFKRVTGSTVREYVSVQKHRKG